MVGQLFTHRQRDLPCDQTMAGLTYLFRQDGRYFFRRRVPRDLVPLIHKSEIKVSLGAGCSLRDAKAHVVYLSSVYQDFFGRVRMADSDLEEENRRLKGLIKETLGSQHKRMIQAKKNRGSITLDLSTDMPLPKSLGGNAEVPIEQHRVNMDEVAKEWAKETAAANQQTLDTNKALTAAIINAGSLVQPTKSLPTVSDFQKDFVTEKSKKWSESAKRHNLNAIDLFIKIVGDRSLSDFDRHDIVDYIDTMEMVHKSYGKSIKDKDRTIDEILAVGSNKQKMTITTLEKHLHTVQALFRAANQYHASALNVENLFGGLRFSKDVRKADKRIPWSVDDLNKLFATPQWTGTSKVKRSLRYNVGNKIIKDAYWWLPLIGIFTGMRLEEICQLQCGDLKSLGDIQYLDVAEGDGKRLKTVSSARQVPIHAVLIDLGFISLFDKENSTQRIFPELTRGGVDKKFGYDYSADFAVYRRKIDIYQEWKDFHSFRHTFISALWQQIRDMVLVGSIVGHGSSSQTEDYTHIDLTTKAGAIALLDYEGLNISHLYQP